MRSVEPRPGTVALERHRAGAVREPLADELAELPRLAVRQRVHRVDDDGLDALARTPA